MKLNRKFKVLLVTTLASASCISLITATATTAQAQQHNDSQVRHHVIAQREEVPPAPPQPPKPEPRPPEPPLRQHDERR